MADKPTLSQIIATHIYNHPQKRITFAEYMDMVLYHPEYGYYSSHTVNIGFQGGDFFTSSSLGNDFGELLAIQFYQMWENLDKPKLFHLVEMGAGKGILAAQILNYLTLNHPDFFRVIEYIIIEKSPSLKQAQQQQLKDFSVKWLALEEIKPNLIIGCVFSNELVDAFPVHQFTIANGKLKEIYVTVPEHRENNLSDDSLTETIGEPSTSKLGEYLQLVGIDISQKTYENGYRSEINLAALDWLGIVADCLQQGYVLTIDYGYPAQRYYNPRRSQGTLQCYYQHRHHNNPYINIGQQDITAHIDFTALEIWGEKCSLNTVGWTQQGLFLMALGLGTRIAALSHQEQSISHLLKRREALHQLISPEGLGNFGVLVQSKGLTHTQSQRSLQGLTIPE
ncbi:MAG: class I SAM-dependent methyltransferase [Sphaerospermopsis sp. SIO1G2]|nr:class I SAM-dependent methyltransferase [Sphaerospermopsis sp. SIO1G1]NET70386.1 class I SAM-dependent methyltransferase [Sphaerospermopsis sp. SIO1G2]